MRGLKFNRVRGAEVGILSRRQANPRLILPRRQASAAEIKFAAP